MGADESLFIVEDDDLDSEHSKLGLGSEQSDDLVVDNQLNGHQNGDLEVHAKPSERVRCHTGSIDHLYCMWHGSKYCCSTPEPKLDAHQTTGEDFFDDCLNYLECSDVMMDYENGMWQRVLLGNEPDFLLESDQDDETKVSQDCLKECDRLPTGVTCASEGSNDTLSMDDLTSLCVSHSQPPRLNVKRDIPRDNLKALQPEMVITAGHQEDNTPSLKRKERCKLPHSAIQNEPAGIDEDNVENSLRGDLLPCIKQRTQSPYMELYLLNVLDNSDEDLIAMTEESTEDPPMHHFSKDKEALDQTDTEGPGTSEPIEEWEDDQHSTNDISEDDSLQDEELSLERTSGRQTESPLIVIEDIDEEGPTEDEEDHTQLIQFLKQTIQQSKSCDQLAEESPNTEVNEDIPQLEETKICLSESEDINQCFSDANEENEGKEMPLAFEYHIENLMVGYWPQIPNGGFEITEDISDIEDGEHVITEHNGTKIKENELQILDDESQIAVNKSPLEGNESEILDYDLEILRNESNILENESEIVENQSMILDDESYNVQNVSQVEGNKSQIVENELQIEGDESQILANESYIDGNETQVLHNETQILGNESQIGENELQMFGNESHIGENELQMLGNETHILNKESEFLENESEIVGNKTTILDNNSQILENESQIEENWLKFLVIESQILSNQSELLGNESEIMGNKTPILDNVSKILEDDSQVEENELQFLVNESHILNNESELVGNESEIVGNKTPILNDSQILEYESQIEENELQFLVNDSQILNNESELMGNESQITGNKSPILDNESHILGNGSEIMKDVSQILHNVSQILQNESQILDAESQNVKYESEIGDNKSEIVNYESRDVENESQISNNESKNVDYESQILNSSSQILDNGSQLEVNGSEIMDFESQVDDASQMLDIVPKTELIRAQFVDSGSCYEDTASPAVIIIAHSIDDRSPDKDFTLENKDIVPQTVLLESQFVDNCNFSKQDCTDSRLYNDNAQECEILQIIGCTDLVDPIIRLHDISQQDKTFHLRNDTTLYRSPKEQSSDLDTNTTVEDIKEACGCMEDPNALFHEVKDEINLMKESSQHPPLRNISNKGYEISYKSLMENFQRDLAERPLGGCVKKTSSLVKARAAKYDNIAEMKRAHSLHHKDYIPNSNELPQVCRDPHIIREGGGGGGGGGGAGQALTSTLDQTITGTSCSTHLIGCTNLYEKNTENKMVKKKFKSSGKLPITDSKEKLETVDANEAFSPDDEKRLKRENSIEGTPSKDSKKAPQLTHSIQAELFPDRSGNLKLFCNFGEIHADSTITWTKDSKLLARLHRSSKDDSPVSLAIVQTSKKDQGQYNCTLKNIHGKVSTEFHLTEEVLEMLTHNQDGEGGEEIEFNQLFFREDFITDMYFGGNLHGRIATEDLHFGEGVHRKAFRSKVMCGLFPVFNPGHLCVLKVHNAIAYGTKNNDELVQKNYKLAVQECYVQNTAREYAKIYAAEAEQLEEFGKVPEIIPIFLIHRPANNIPYATVEEELIGNFVKYSIKDGKEINVLRKDSEAGQKCCTFQHWVYERTNGNLLVTDMQGVGMKLTDVGIATMGKGYKGFKGNCSVSFIDQFRALHQCNKYCEILSLKCLRPSVKQKKPVKDKPQPNPVKDKPQPNPVKDKPQPNPVKDKPQPNPIKDKPQPNPIKDKPQPNPVKDKPQPIPSTSRKMFQSTKAKKT